MKKCSTCEKTKPLDGFHKNTSSKDGLQSVCKPCHREAVTQYRSTNMPLVLTQNRESYARHPRAARNKYLVYIYGITIEQYEELFDAQNGVCAICLRPETERDRRSGKPKNLSIDHDHACCPGKRSCGECVRGLLCSHCNRGLGLFRDSSGLLRAATRYVDTAK